MINVAILSCHSLVSTVPQEQEGRVLPATPEAIEWCAAEKSAQHPAPQAGVQTSKTEQENASHASNANVGVHAVAVHEKSNRLAFVQSSSAQSQTVTVTSLPNVVCK